jgi:hypothetical protein
MPWPRSLSALLAAPLLAGCTTLHAYPGAPREASQVASLRPAVMPAQLILLDAVDGEALGWLQDRAELLPGAHTARVTAVLRGRERELEFTHELAFTAEAGREYLVYAELGPYGPRTFILDDRSGRIVAESVDAPARLSERTAPRRSAH